ncbi:MAG: siderophore-interacting protein [Rothia sp. (in: high G+C Gram-positive bacteria)]|uniref:siderophore-interacting protein n=1 Tax=Rothia sp. (in: high G+C Gram-positive bacteria) TaxID=1885016 RepID=UPI0027095A18|nr:siderophore-interacting protein [Rothia sp. (in: high G+C Gram-positive bacteria)]
MTHPRVVSHPLVLRQATVLNVQRPTPRLLRVTLGGPELQAFERDGLKLPPFTSPIFDDHIKLIFSSDGNTEAVLPTQNEHGIDWNFSDQLITRDYTPRRFDADLGELDLEFVIHEGGTAVDWALKAQPGDCLWFVGPKSSTVLPENLTHIIFLCDETGLPALARFLEERPSPAAITAIIFIRNNEARISLPLSSGDSLRWVVGNPSDPQIWEEAARSLNLNKDNNPYIFAAGESRALLPLRRYLSRELGLNKHQLNITGYWHITEETQESSRQGLVPVLPESPLPWLAVRAGLQLGLLQELAHGRWRSLTDLAEQLGADLLGLKALCQALAERQILIYKDHQVQLGEAGHLLFDDDHLVEHFLGYHADQFLALLNLHQQIGASKLTSWEQYTGSSLRRQALYNTEVYEELVERAEAIEYVASNLFTASRWADNTEVLVQGPGSLTVAKLYEAQKVKLDVKVLEEEPALSLLRKKWEEEPHSLRVSFTSTWEPVQVAISALSSHAMTNAQLAEHLTEAAKYVQKLILIVEEGTDQLIPHAAEHDLLRYALIGQAQRGEESITLLAHNAGFTTAERSPLGWGLAAYTLSMGEDKSNIS